MNVLLIGGGGREHTLAWKISQSKLLTNLFIAPGNPGTAHCGTNLNIAVNDITAIKKAVWENDIDLVIVGPEDPLVNGLSDEILADEVLKDVMVIGPKKVGAQLEGSKKFAKEFMLKHNIPTARYKSFVTSQSADAKSFLKELSAPYVIKADGLAAGKGVVIAQTLNEAEQTIDEMLGGKFGKASETLVIEEFLQGIEVSYFVLCNNDKYVLLPNAKDYKRIGDNDTGLNTGGMGTISPASGVATDSFTQKVIQKVIEPTLQGLKKDNIDYCGFIFFGLISVDGNPYVIEYNCRLGDPETESIMLRIESDLLELFQNCWNKKILPNQIKISDNAAATVILASQGYPEKFEKGFEITIDESKLKSHIFHAGTMLKNDVVTTSGGRVIAVSSVGKNLSEALQNSYTSINYIHFQNKYFRKDIGQDILKLIGEKSLS